MDIQNEQMHELKQIETEMLCHFINICEKLDLRYYMVCGTLLGSVRHGGFIPWDDDIDIGMPRKDYEIFLQKGQALLPEHCFLQTHETDPEFPANFAKIRNSNTTFIETSVRNRNINHGVYIDIFPLDFYPDGTWQKKWFQLREYILRGRISCAFYYKNGLRLISRLKMLVCRFACFSLKKTLRARDKLFASVTDGTCYANHCGAWGEREILPVEWFGDGCQLEFEGIKVNAPVEYDKVLTHVYGDYMQLPPVEKRVAHHYADMIDLHRSYLEYRSKK